MRHRSGLIVFLFAGFLAAAIGGCQDEATTGLEVTGVRFAKPGTQDPEVTSTDPTGAPQDTTLDVEVSGSGFDDGSTVQLTLSGIPTEKVRTNSTHYRNARTLIANITITADADVDLYDVEVTTSSRKKGIGTEMFEVFQKDRGNAPTAILDFQEPGPEDPQGLHDLQSSAQAMWGDNKGKKWQQDLDLDPFALTLAFPAGELDPSTWAYVTDPDEKAECEEVSRRLAFLQAQPQPLVGSFSFLYDVGSSKSSTTVWLDVVVGAFKFNVRNWSCTTCYRNGQPILTVSEETVDGRPVTTFQVRGGSVTIHKTPADGPPGKGEDDPQTCGQPVLHYVLRVFE